MQIFEERFEAKIERITESGCWIWMGCLSPDGYGYVGMHRVSWAVHRLSYELNIGPIKKGLQIDHLCRVRSCCNPFHLEAVTIKENVRRSENPAGINSRKTHCLRGHKFDRVYAGERCCSECQKARSKKYKDKKRALKAASMADSQYCTICSGSGHGPDNCPWIRHVRLAGR